MQEKESITKNISLVTGADGIFRSLGGLFTAETVTREPEISICTCY